MSYWLLPLILLAAGLAYLAVQPATFEIRRSLTMSVDRSTVFAKVRDLRGWRDWSPWLLHEPDARLAYSPHPDQKGGFYTWDGPAIGAGRLTHLRLDEPTRIDQRLEFKRPFKAVSETWWEFAEPADGGTAVTWCMRGRLPFLLRFLTGMVSRMTGNDFELGLALLRGTLDPTAERPLVRFQGACERPAQDVLTIPFSGGLADLIATARSGFPRLDGYLAAAGATPPGPPFTVIYKANAKATQFTCDLALPVPTGVDPGEFKVKRLDGGRYFVTELQGSYQFLGPVWSSVMAHLQMHKIRRDRSRPCLEVYVNDPTKVAHSNDLLTRILVPVA
jgi:DNA gyrase inhibitor GyrI